MKELIEDRGDNTAGGTLVANPELAGFTKIQLTGRVDQFSGRPDNIPFIRQKLKPSIGKFDIFIISGKKQKSQFFFQIGTESRLRHLSIP